MDDNTMTAGHLENEIETRATGKVDDRDELTGVHARFALLNSVNYDALSGKDVVVALCDLDNFRMINDAYGENRGNDVLAHIGQIMQTCFGDDHVCRYGSDEFLVIDTFHDEKSFLDKIRDMEHCINSEEVEGMPLFLTCSYGYSYGKLNNSDDLHEAIRLADRKMYEAKRMGKARAIGAPLECDPLHTTMHAAYRQYKSYEMDELTGLANLVYFRNKLGSMLFEQGPVEDVPEDERLTLVYFNVQNFKGYNEKYGFDAGDELLVLIADAIRDAYEGCMAARFSSDQFMVATTALKAEAGVEQVRAAFRRRQKTTSIWLKAGIYVTQDEDLTNVGLCTDRPKIACDSIRGRRDIFYCYYDDTLKAQIQMQRYVLENFERALEEHWVKVFYQPIVRVATGEVCDEEALARWVDPDRGIISPAGFIPVLEEARLIHELDLYIVHHVCEGMELAKNNGMVTAVSVNLSPLDFELCDIVEEVVKIVDEAGVDHSALSIELTESAFAENQEFLKAEIDRFRERGFEVWMDDFGSGYSSLNTLKGYNFDLVKVDMGFLRDFEDNEQARILLSHIVGMAKELGLKTLVEGVETEEQCEFLSSIGCGRAQGYFFGKPSSANDMVSAVKNGNYPQFELPDHYHFYEAVGRVNLLRPDPARPIDGHYVPGDIPAAILRRHDGIYEYLNVSNVYRTFLQAMGAKSVEESERRLNDPTRVEHIRIDESVDICVSSGEWEWATYYENGKYCSMRLKCIASNPEEHAVAIIVVAVNVQESSLMTHV